MSRRLGAHELIDLWADPGSFESWDAAPDLGRFGDGYRERLRSAAARAGADEAIVTGRARLGGQDAALVVSEFGFLGGSIGSTAADRIVAAIRRATVEGLPVIASPASGGTRLQEGTPAFLRMIDIVRVVEAHQRRGLLFLVYLRDPTTGGVLASWGSLGHVAIAEPGALIAFLGPKVVAAVTGAALPDESVRGESLVRSGVLDGTLAAEEFGAMAASLLAPDRMTPSSPPDPAAGRPGSEDDPWAAVQATRVPDRPGLRELVAQAFSDPIPLRHRAGGAIVPLIARLRGRRCVVIGQDREAQLGHPLDVASLRAARHAMEVARELRLPIVTVVDTRGAELSAAAESDGIAAEMAACLKDLVAHPAPSVGVLLGEGTGGAALALLATGSIVAAADAWLAPLPLEGASAILFGDTAHAPRLARDLGMSAGALHRMGHVRALVPPPDRLGAEAFCTAVADAVAEALVAT